MTFHHLLLNVCLYVVYLRALITDRWSQWAILIVYFMWATVDFVYSITCNTPSIWICETFSALHTLLPYMYGRCGMRHDSQIVNDQKRINRMKDAKKATTKKQKCQLKGGENQSISTLISLQIFTSMSTKEY